MPVYINIHIFLYVNINIYIIIYILHRQNSSVSPHLLQENIHAPQHELVLLPWYFFLPISCAFLFLNPTLQLWSITGNEDKHTLAFHLTASIHRPKSRTGTKLQRHLSCLLPLPQSQSRGRREGCVESGDARVLLCSLSSTAPLPCL